MIPGFVPDSDSSNMALPLVTRSTVAELLERNIPPPVELAVHGTQAPLLLVVPAISVMAPPIPVAPPRLLFELPRASMEALSEPAYAMLPEEVMVTLPPPPPPMVKIVPLNTIAGLVPLLPVLSSVTLPPAPVPLDVMILPETSITPLLLVDGPPLEEIVTAPPLPESLEVVMLPPMLIKPALALLAAPPVEVMLTAPPLLFVPEIGRASCRER